MKTAKYSIFKDSEETLAQWQVVSGLFSSEYVVYAYALISQPFKPSARKADSVVANMMKGNSLEIEHSAFVDTGFAEGFSENTEKEILASPLGVLNRGGR